MKEVVNINIVLVGPGGCGLTAMIKRYLYDESMLAYIPTVYEEHKAVVHIKNKLMFTRFAVNLKITDTPGQEDFVDLRVKALCDADVAIVAFDCSALTNPINSIKKIWLPEVQRSTTVQRTLVAGKIDLCYAYVSRKMKKEFDDYFKCSSVAKNPKWHVKRVFEAAILSSLEHKERTQLSSVCNSKRTIYQSST